MVTYNSQMFYLGNFADMDTDETDNDAENDGLIVGTYNQPPLLDVTVVDANNDSIVSDDETGTSPFEYIEYDAGSGLTQQYIDSTIVYDVDVLLGDGSTISIPATAIQLQNGDVFITDYANGGTFDNLGVQSLTLSNPYSDFVGFFADSSVDNSSVVCFASNTLIDTSTGARPVETLCVGDLVQTMDHGLQPIQWIGEWRHAAPGKHAPIVFSLDSLAPGVPDHELNVSPQHRILISSPISEKMFGALEVIVAAKALLGLPGVFQRNGDEAVTYWHFACADHQLVKANGAWAETFYPGSVSLGVLNAAQQEELLALMGPLENEPALARGTPPMRRQMKLAQRIAQHWPNRYPQEQISVCDTRR